MAFDISRVPNIALLFSDKLFEKNAFSSRNLVTHFSKKLSKEYFAIESIGRRVPVKRLD